MWGDIQVVRSSILSLHNSVALVKLYHTCLIQDFLGSLLIWGCIYKFSQQNVRFLAVNSKSYTVSSFLSFSTSQPASLQPTVQKVAVRKPGSLNRKVNLLHQQHVLSKSDEYHIQSKYLLVFGQISFAVCVCVSKCLACGNVPLHRYFTLLGWQRCPF